VIPVNYMDPLSTSIKEFNHLIKSKSIIKNVITQLAIYN
jgi:hypothetical protein